MPTLPSSWRSLAGAALLSLLLPAMGLAEGPYLLNAQQATWRTKPDYIRDHIAHVETLPFDGLVMSTETGRTIMNGEARSQQAIAADFAALSGVTFVRMKHNFALVNVDRPADFFDDWSVTVENFRQLSRVLKTHGLKGVMLDNEEYGRRLFNYPDDCDYPSKTLAEYQAQARLRGREIMRAMSGEYPRIVVIALHGPYSSFSETPAEVIASQTYWEVEELRGAFSVGLMEGMDSRSRFVDGGEMYGYRTEQDFEASHSYRKFTLGAPETMCPFISEPLRDVWPQKLGIAFGVYNDSFPSGLTMDPATLRTTLERALARCDDYVWLYTEDLNWNGPGEVGREWYDAVAASYDPAPWVAVSAPVDGLNFIEPASPTILVEASQPDGTIEKVEFYAGTSKIGEDTARPYSLTWQNAPVGNHSITAIAISDSGAFTSSAPVRLSVTSHFEARINFQPAGSPPPPGFSDDTGEAFGDRGNGLAYGWTAPIEFQMRERATIGSRELATLCQFLEGDRWEIAVPNGAWHVTVKVGDSYPSTYTINVEGQPLWDAVPLDGGEFLSGTLAVEVADGRITIDQGAAKTDDTRIQSVLISQGSAPPAAPVSLTATTLSPTEILLAWSDRSPNETGFILERSAAPDFSSVVQQNVSADSEQYVDSGLEPSATHYYRIRATNGNGTSAFSNHATARTPFPDIDMDGIPDTLEGGATPFLVGVDDGLEDTDQDGMSNSAEFLARTDATDPGSRLHISHLAATGDTPTTVVLGFPTISGVAYFAEYTNTLNGGIWTFLPNSDRIGDDTVQTVNDSTATPNRFYRIRIDDAE